MDGDGFYDLGLGGMESMHVNDVVDMVIDGNEPTWDGRVGEVADDMTRVEQAIGQRRTFVAVRDFSIVSTGLVEVMHTNHLLNGC